MAYRRKGYRRYRKQRSRRGRPHPNKWIGQPLGSQRTVKEYGTQTISSQLATEALFNNVINDLPKTTTSDNNERNNNVIDLRGLKVQLMIQNNTTSVLCLNVAVISPKDRITTATTSVSSTDFFIDRRAGSGYQSFTTTLTGPELWWNGINTDRFAIMRHKRYYLNPQSVSTGENREKGASFKSLKWYLPVKRLVTYTGTAGDTQYSKIFLVMWCAPYAQTSAQGPVANAIDIEGRTSIVYKDGK